MGIDSLAGRLYLPPEPADPVPKLQMLFFAREFVALTILQADEQFGDGRLVVAVYTVLNHRSSKAKTAERTSSS